MQFTYTARNTSGQNQTGELVAESREEAVAKLRQEGLYLLALDESDASSANTTSIARKKRVPRKEIIYFTNQLAIMVDAGVPVATALEGISKQIENPVLAEILAHIQKSVESGSDLSAALADFPRQFDRTYVNLIKASEASGTMPQMLNRIAAQAEEEQETIQQVKGALIYPAIMLVMCVGVCIFLLTYVFPKLMPMFASRGAAIPGPTKAMIMVSTAMTTYWYLIILFLAALAGAFCYVRNQAWGKSAFDWILIRLPVFGSMLKKLAISRSIRTLATTVNAGVPMLEAIELSSGVTDNVHFKQSWMEISELVTTGKQIHEALEGKTLFPPTMQQMIASGESTGRLGMVLNKLSDYFDREVKIAIKSATTLIEPIMVVCMGSIIGFIALSMLLPIFTLSTSH
ncbi:type II secretion system F family protein [Gimesia sp.]|uniref:type II secretion system F family protein n=1 Tax=Gimesia sp. TaxID=2024833 RepID=UPI000C4EA660|nr:type II secretion system F family protein [Gimesia sp.]MAX38514.1 pilus assembly protein PilC [Gimesia sp.]HBL41848.1 type II secretion system F family protein [Planctomycetaceae bacterium]|tara:strand:+ start:9841 stop:11046 length:1206 start_codon:yes stop_codon:yes gene_type:complete